MRRIANGFSKIDYTVKILLVCFLVYFIANAFQ